MFNNLKEENNSFQFFYVTSITVAEEAITNLQKQLSQSTNLALINYYQIFPIFHPFRTAKNWIMWEIFLKRTEKKNKYFEGCSRWRKCVGGRESFSHSRLAHLRAFNFMLFIALPNRVWNFICKSVQLNWS